MRIASELRLRNFYPLAAKQRYLMSPDGEDYSAQDGAFPVLGRSRSNFMVYVAYYRLGDDADRELLRAALANLSEENRLALLVQANEQGETAIGIASLHFDTLTACLENLSEAGIEAAMRHLSQSLLRYSVMRNKAFLDDYCVVVARYLPRVESRLRLEFFGAQPGDDSRPSHLLQFLSSGYPIEQLLPAVFEGMDNSQRVHLLNLRQADGRRLADHLAVRNIQYVMDFLDQQTSYVRHAVLCTHVPNNRFVMSLLEENRQLVEKWVVAVDAQSRSDLLCQLDEKGCPLFLKLADREKALKGLSAFQRLSVLLSALDTLGDREDSVFDDALFSAVFSCENTMLRSEQRERLINHCKPRLLRAIRNLQSDMYVRLCESLSDARRADSLLYTVLATHRHGVRAGSTELTASLKILKKLFSDHDEERYSSDQVALRIQDGAVAFLSERVLKADDAFAVERPLSEDLNPDLFTSRFEAMLKSKLTVQFDRFFDGLDRLAQHRFLLHEDRRYVPFVHIFLQYEPEKFLQFLEGMLPSVHLRRLSSNFAASQEKKSAGRILALLSAKNAMTGEMLMHAISREAPALAIKLLGFLADQLNPKDFYELMHAADYEGNTVHYAWYLACEALRAAPDDAVVASAADADVLGDSADAAGASPAAEPSNLALDYADRLSPANRLRLYSQAVLAERVRQDPIVMPRVTRALLDYSLSRVENDEEENDDSSIDFGRRSRSVPSPLLSFEERREVHQACEKLGVAKAELGRQLCEMIEHDDQDLYVEVSDALLARRSPVLQVLRPRDSSAEERAPLRAVNQAIQDKVVDLDSDEFIERVKNRGLFNVLGDLLPEGSNASRATPLMGPRTDGAVKAYTYRVLLLTVVQLRQLKEKRSLLSEADIQALLSSPLRSGGTVFTELLRLNKIDLLTELTSGLSNVTSLQTQFLLQPMGAYGVRVHSLLYADASAFDWSYFGAFSADERYQLLMAKDEAGVTLFYRLAVQGKADLMLAMMAGMGPSQRQVLLTTYSPGAMPPLAYVSDHEALLKASLDDLDSNVQRSMVAEMAHSRVRWSAALATLVATNMLVKTAAKIVCTSVMLKMLRLHADELSGAVDKMDAAQCRAYSLDAGMFKRATGRDLPAAPPAASGLLPAAPA